MKKFFLLSGTGRLKRGRYALYLLLIGSVWMLAELVESIPLGLAALLELACLCGWIYIISARLHDLGDPGWIAWIRLLLNVISWFGEGFAIVAKILILPLGLALLFGKGVEKDNEFGPNPYLGKEKHDSDKEKVENVEQKVESKEKDVEKEIKKPKKLKKKHLK